MRFCKKLLVLGILMFLWADVSAQTPNAYYSDVVLSDQGIPVAGASVHVYEAGKEVEAQIFSGESKGTTKSAVFLDLLSATTDASSVGWGMSQSLCFDDNLSTRWSSLAGSLPPYSTPSSSSQWVWVDLGGDIPLESVSVDFQDSAAVDYTVRLLTAGQAAGLGLSANGTAGGGVGNWTTIATAVDLPNGITSPNRNFSGVADVWDFKVGLAAIPDNTTGTATVNVLNPVGRYVLIDMTEVSDAVWGNVSIWEIKVSVDPDWAEDSGLPNMRYVLYTTGSDNFVEQSNPIITDEAGRFSFFVANGDYDIHISDGSSVEYSLNDVTLVNPHSPHNIRTSSKTPPLTLVERGVKTSGGNNALVFNRPNSTDGNNPPTPYRIIVNKGKQGWALTLNADWDEITNAWKPRTIGNQSFVFRINGDDHSLEYGNDSFTDLSSPVMETLFRVSADGEMSAKAFGGGYAMEVKNNTGGTLNIGNVVVLDPSDPFAVIKPRKYADENPMVVYKKDGSRVFVMISGRIVPNTAGAINLGDLLVTEGAGSLRAVAASGGVDPRAVIGRVSNRSLSTIIP